MPQDKDLKRLVRSRMQETGERYTQAKAALDNRARPDGIDPLHRQWVEWLGDKTKLHEAFRLLEGLPHDEIRALAIAGASHQNWRVRRGCCRLLDDLAITPESLAVLERGLQDPEPRVRRAAMHTLSCQECKPEGCVVDSRSIFERMAGDRNRNVRKMVLTSLWSVKGPWVEDLLRRFLDDPSAGLREKARREVDRLELMRRTNRERQKLPPDLLAKTERHRGRWVGIRDGRIVGVGGQMRTIQRAELRRGQTDLHVYWVDNAESHFPGEEAQP